MRKIYLFSIFCWMSFSLSMAQNSIATLSLEHIEETHIQQSTVISQDTVLTLNYPETITGLSVSGSATLNHTSNSLIRITLQDDYNTEWLVYELFPLLSDSNMVTFNNVAFETSVLENVTARQLNIKVINASLQLDEINTSNQAIANYSSQQSRVMQSQSSYIIDRLNENLEKRDIPWRAGETSISQMTYEEKKAMFGGEVPNLGGFEYYKGGIFIMPDYEPAANDGIATVATTDEEEDPYVKEWDWRNRHGKNWMTSVKNQGGCRACWAFAAIGALEAYINLYYNQLLNLDLSEQELVSCATINSTVGIGCSGGNFNIATEYIKNFGIIDEVTFPYIESNGNCSNKPTESIEKFYISADNGIEILNATTGVAKIKESLFKSPIVMGIINWDHDMVLVGYKKIKAGDIIYMTATQKDTISINSPLIGKDVFILKNSYSEWWGDNGYMTVYLGDNTTVSIGTFYGTTIESKNHTNNDILLEDNDEDGYYFHGISPVSFSLPREFLEADGDDSNSNYAYADQYGNLIEVVLDTTVVKGSVPSMSLLFPYDYYWNFIPNHIIIKNGGSLTVDGNYVMHRDVTITVQNGGTLTVSGSTIKNANIILESGATMYLTNNGHITLNSEDNFCAKQGSILNIGNNSSIDIE